MKKGLTVKLIEDRHKSYYLWKRSDLKNRVLLHLDAHIDFGPRNLTNIGNYIYPAIREGIVSEFCWIIPGDKKEFKKSLKNIKNILRNLSLRDSNSIKKNS